MPMSDREQMIFAARVRHTLKHRVGPGLKLGKPFDLVLPDELTANTVAKRLKSRGCRTAVTITLAGAILTITPGKR
jgi:hypothetical protein